MMRLPTLCFALLFLSLSAHMLGQNTSPSQLGLAPGVPYDGHGIDNINLLSGNVAINIPLVSFPQRGPLKLSFSLRTNTSTFREVAECNQYSTPLQCSFQYQPFGAAGQRFAFGPAISEDELLTLQRSWNVRTDIDHPYGGGMRTTHQYSYTYTVSDSTGAEHRLWVEQADNKRLHASDGSGLALALQDNAQTGGGSSYRIFDSNGSTLQPAYDPNSQTQSGFVRKDVDGNTISFDNASATYTDTVHRLIPDFPNTGLLSSAAGCPTVQSGLKPTGSRSWSVPGAQGNPQTYLVCYTDVNVHTNFFENNGDPLHYYVNGPDGAEGAVQWDYYEFSGPVSTIQSVTLPDGRVWGFKYDTADATKPLSYGDLISITFPDGGSVSYEYQNQSYPCGGSGDYQERRREVTKRTLTNANGRKYVWSYQIPFSQPGYPGNGLATVTDSNNNQAVHKFEASPLDGSGCLSREIKVDQYQGFSAPNKVPLQTTETTFAPASVAPQDWPAMEGQEHFGAGWTGYSPVINSLPETVKTYLDGVLVSAETKHYDSNTFSVVSLYCFETESSRCLGANPSYQSDGSTQASLGISTGSTTVDGHALVAEIVTRYRFGSNSAYFDKNLLRSIQEQSKSEGGMTVDTLNEFDEADWLPTGSSGTLGHVTTTTQRNDSGPDIVTHQGWTSTGLLDRSVDGRGIATRFHYNSADGAFTPSSLAKGVLSLTLQHDLNTGLLLQSTDSNSATTTYKFDPTGRPWGVQSPELQSTNGYAVVYCYPSPGVVTTLTAQASSISLPITSSQCPQNVSDSVQSTKTYDGLGRLSQQVIAPDHPDQTSTVDYTYDGEGNLIRQTQPYRGQVAGDAIETEYDALNRPSLRTFSGSSDRQQWQYSKLTTTYTDEARNNWQRTTDALGRLVGVVEPNGLLTTYRYKLSFLVGVTQQGQAGESLRDRTFSYDSLGRLVTTNNPETGAVCYGILGPLSVKSGSSVGTRSCTGGYDENGNVLFRSDERGSLTSFTYDSLDRILTRAQNGTVINQYVYDGAVGAWAGTGFVGSNTIGRLSFTRSFNPSLVGSCDQTTKRCDDQYYGYDARGRLNHLVEAPPSEWGSDSHSVEASFDLAGNLIEVVYPNSTLTIDQTFDNAGRLSKIVDHTTGKPIVKSITYLPSGVPDTIVYGNGADGNGVRESFALTGRLNPCSHQILLPISAGGTMVLKKRYFYSGDIAADCVTASSGRGNIASISDQTNTAQGSDRYTENFEYDILNRLTHFKTMMGGQAREQKFNYDSFGNILSMTSLVAPTTVPDPLNFTATYTGGDNRIDASSFACLPMQPGNPTPQGTPGQVSVYDLAGNIRCNGTQGSDAHAFIWDPENRLTEVWAQQNNNTYAQSAIYTYDAQGNRIRADQMAPTGPNNQSQSQSFREYTFFGGQMLAEKDQTEAWTDYVYAGGKKIAMVKPVQPTLHLSGDRNGGNPSCGFLWGVSVPALASVQGIRSGDTLHFDAMSTGLPIGVNLGVDGNSAYPGAVTTGDGRWGHFSVDLSNWSSASSLLMGNALSYQPQVAWDFYLRNLTIQSADGSVRPLFTGGSASGSLWNGCALTRASFAVEATDIGPALGTNYYLADHLGTTQLEFSAAGLPVWRGEFAPFGQELDGQTTANRFKFTGKERDTESGLDYFPARYYGSNMGRWMSPDYSDDDSQGEPIPYFNPSNPQSLNLYAYAHNNPITGSDPDGHSVNVCTTDSSGNQQCTLLSNEQYQAATQGNGSLNVPTLDQVGSNGNGSGQFNSTNITDSSGNTVGTATYVSDGGADYYANANGYNQLANTSKVVKAGTVAYTAIYAGAFVGAGGLSLGGELTTLGDLSPNVQMTEHGIQRLAERGITPGQVQEAVDAAKKAGDVVQKVGKYGTKQLEYTANGLKVFVEQEGANAGKVITAYFH